MYECMNQHRNEIFASEAAAEKFEADQSSDLLAVTEDSEPNPTLAAHSRM